MVKQTSLTIASLAGRILANPNTTNDVKKLAASDLSQAPKKKKVILRVRKKK